MPIQQARGFAGPMKRLFRNLLADAVQWLRKKEAARERWQLVERGLLVIGRHTYGCPRIWNYHGSERKVIIGSFCSKLLEVAWWDWDDARIRQAVPLLSSPQVRQFLDRVRSFRNPTTAEGNSATP
jgi:ABC-type antimicrobial peptide transport system ATPase subunit